MSVVRKVRSQSLSYDNTVHALLQEKVVVELGLQGVGVVYLGTFTARRESRTALREAGQHGRIKALVKRCL